jgi:hypothetical protein
MRFAPQIQKIVRTFKGLYSAIFGALMVFIAEIINVMGRLTIVEKVVMLRCAR